MIAVVFLLPVLAAFVLWPSAVPTVALLCIVAAGVTGAILSALGPSERGTPDTIRRLPTQHEQRRWGLGLGLAIGFHSVFPFIYIRRRLR